MVLKDSCEVVPLESGEAALEWLEKNAADLVLLDILMPGMDGIEVLERIREKDRFLPVVMLTATKTVKTAVTAMKLGAFDYITKPFDVDELRLVVQRATENANLKREVEELREAVGKRFSFENIIGESEAMQKVFRTVMAVAPLKTTVLITGESGTGKELIAKAIHYNSPRKDKPLVTLNCAAIPENLLESELFGHEKGSFTDAVDKKIGQFELAHTGTIFLDEIGEMSSALQAKLLRVLEQGEIMRVGGDRPIPVDVRVVAATNRNLQQAIQEGRFRSDLYYRLNVVSLEIPPLRERREDIPHLIRHFLDLKSKELGLPRREITPAAVDRLLQYPWPGNVRELENVIERVLVLSPGEGPIGPEHLPRDLIEGPSVAIHVREQVLSGYKSLAEAVDEFERDIISEALQRTHYNQTRAAAVLGTTRRILKYRMDKLGIEPRER
ncbi:MAG: sigma-54-dependent Fis family transcriptional regulator [Candidatus Dadabacteria bacterium]|nr:MAG: sigma-54-dependent Fis family transcriptional regulator [Candidatus Dadabacteria bacterium]